MYKALYILIHLFTLHMHTLTNTLMTRYTLYSSSHNEKHNEMMHKTEFNILQCKKNNSSKSARAGPTATNTHLSNCCANLVEVDVLGFTKQSLLIK